MTFVDCICIYNIEVLIIIPSIQKLIHMFLAFVSFRKTVHRFVEQTLYHNSILLALIMFSECIHKVSLSYQLSTLVKCVFLQ